MKITILQGPFLPIPPLKGGAVEKLWFELGKQFALLGNSVVHISRRHPDLPDVGLLAGVEHIRLPGFDMPSNIIVSLFYDLLYSFRALLALPQADILITNTFWMPILRKWFRSSTGSIVISVERMPKGQMFLYRHAQCLRCCSEPVRQRVLSEQVSLLPKAVVIPNPLPFDPASFQLSLPKQPVFLYCGRLHPEKGLGLLIRAFAKFQLATFSEWSLRIVGPSNSAYGGGGDVWADKLKTLSYGCSSSVSWVGPLYDQHLLHCEYSKASIFVYPSLAERGEALPIAPLEAMAFGAVPIVSMLPCFNDYIVNGQNGLMFNHAADDPVDSLCSAMLYLASDPKRLQLLSNAALNVRSTHNPRLIASQMVAHFESIVS